MRLQLFPRKLCRACGSRLDVRIQHRGRHWNCELPKSLACRDDEELMARHMITTSIRLRPCPQCGAPTLVGLDEGMPTAVELAVVSPIEELNALIAGLASYDLVTVAGRTELVYRDTFRMNHREFPVAISHPHRPVAFIPDPADAWKKGKGTAPPKAGKPLPDTPPF